MNLRAAFVFSLVIATPLAAQVGEKTPPGAAEAQAVDQTPRLEEAATKASEPVRKLRLITNATTLNYLAKFDGAGNSTDSAVFEAAGLVGIGTATPANALHVKISDGAINVPLKLETSGTDSITGLSLKNDVRNWLIRVDGTDGDKFKIFDANANGGVGAYRFTIDDAGRVGIGTTSPKATLHVYGEAAGDVFAAFGFDPSYLGLGSAMNIGYGGASFGRGAGFFNVRPDALAVPPNPSLRFGTADVERMIITNTGWVGVGTTTPQQKLHVSANEDAGTIIQVENTNTGGNAHSAFRTISSLSTTSYVAHGNRSSSLVRFGIPLAGWGEILNFSGNGYIVGTYVNTPLVFGTNNAERMRILGNGNVGIGTTTPTAKLHVVGDIITTGNITGAKVIGAVYQDLAEWVPATSDMTPGTVVVLNLDRTNEVMPSSRQYDTSVAGVVSTSPGIILGVAGDSKEQIATTGRVKVRVDARTKPVRVGDLLVTSDVPGTAMRSEPMEINGRPFHQPGTIIGKALEPLESGVGEILVLLSLQ